MPERWQRELKKLRDEEMPERIRERAERGPQRQLPSDGGQRVVAGLVAFAVFIAAGAFAWRAFGGDPRANGPATSTPSGQVVTLTLESNGGENPTATLSTATDLQEGARGRYEWCPPERACISQIANFGVPGFLIVDAGTHVDVTGDGRLAALEVRPAQPPLPTRGSIEEVDVDDVTTPKRPGRFLWEVRARWDDGSATFYFGLEVTSTADDIPAVLHLTCTPETASLDADVVRAQPDGVHIAVDAGPSVDGADIVTGTSSESFFGVGLDERDDGSRGIPIEPGAWSVGCYSGARGGIGPSEIGTARAAAFTVVDPEGHYTPVDLACDEPSTRLFPVTGTPSGGVPGTYEASPRTVEESAGAVPGILPTDVVREAGYPDGPGFKAGPIYSVIREGRAVARLHVPVEVSATWGVSVDACPGSGIGPDAPAGAAGPTPETAIVRCLESRIEMATPVVNTQPDGLHVEVENAGGSEALVVVGGGERTRVFSFPIETGSTSLVVPVHPGNVLIACRSNAETAGGHDPFLDRHPGGLHLQDRGGYFVPYAPTCDSSEEIPIEPPRVVIRPRGEAFIRGNLAGVLGSDTVERAGYLDGRGDEGPWRVVRDGQIVAQVEYPSLEGITCRGAGISGT